MNLWNIPWRAHRKYQLDGFSELAKSSIDTFLVNILGYRFLYKHVLQERLQQLSRDRLHAEGDYQIYESCTKEVPTKSRKGIPQEGSPSETYWPGDRFVCTLTDTKVLGPVGPAVTTDGRLIAETVGTPQLADRRVGVAVAKALVNSPRHATATLNGDETPDIQFEMATILLPPWNNYYHWTIECLPRIRLLEMYAAEEGEYPDLLVPSNRSSWVNEMIDRVDYQGRVVTWNGDVAHIDRLVIPSFPDPTREECQWLRNRMRGDEIAGSNKKHIYISRTDATARRVDNIDEIQPVLDRYGFETYVLSELSVAEQINLFANAEVVVAPHGAGLANIVYADDVEVIELFGNKKIASFARLAEILDYGYIDLDCEQRGVNLVVDPDRLDTAIQSIVAE